MKFENERHEPILHPHISYPHITVDLTDDSLLRPVIEDALSQAALTRKIFVICDTNRRARQLMDEFLRSVELPNMTKVITPKREVIMGYETIRFISREQVDVVFTGQHAPQVVWDWEFEDALFRYVNRKEKNDV